MQRKYLFIFSLLIFVAVLLSACGSANTAPVLNVNSSQNRNPVTSNSNGGTNTSGIVSNGARANSPTELEAQTVEGGSVAITVTPLSFRNGAPLEFEIAMNTHSVDLADDILKAVVLRDDSGKEYAPTKWDGPAGGGHHREGKIQFAALPTNSKTLTLVVKNIAGVRERVFKWDAAK